MKTIESLRKNIKSAEDLRAIVKTMKTLAAVNIRHYEKAVESVSNYYRTIELGLQVVLQRGPAQLRPLSKDKGKGVCAVIFGSDQGLCGGFNDHIVSHAFEVMYEREAIREQKLVVCVGSRAAVLLDKEGHPAHELYPVPGSLAGVTPLIQEIVLKIEGWQREGRIDTVLLFHNKPVSSVAYEPHTVHLLPLADEWFESIAGKKWPTRMLPTFTMDRAKLFSSLIFQYGFVSLYRAFVESIASENTARLTSMQSAEKNIEERLEEIYTQYRQQRQDSITAELLDIVSGFEALRDDKEVM
ncbi:MAG: F0F1 ATP synthase subunit gamma [Proteobacteria bacterium]|nr:F0F1 ATP synthase subunit gamma [Pseudomonadota bacterium]